MESQSLYDKYYSPLTEKPPYTRHKTFPVWKPFRIQLSAYTRGRKTYSSETIYQTLGYLFRDTSPCLTKTEVFYLTELLILLRQSMAGGSPKHCEAVS